MTDQEPKITDVFSSISADCQALLIAATHISTSTGCTKDALLAGTEFSEEQLDNTTRELIQRGLIKRGQLEKKQIPGDINSTPHFIENPNGDRFALSREVKTAILTQILHLNQKQIGSNNPNF